MNDCTETNHNDIENKVVPKKRNKNEGSFDYTEIEQMLPEQFDKLFKTLPLTEETTCGIWIFKGELLQK